MPTDSLTITPSLSTSLHPKLHLTGASPQQAPCILHLTVTLSDALFPDPAELADLFGAPSSTPLTASSPSSPSLEAGLDRTRWHAEPSVIDIERPLAPGSVSLSLAIPVRSGDALELEIPLHARYLPPDEAGVVNVTAVEQISGDWTCFARRGDVTHFPVIPPAPVIYALPTARASYRLPVEIATAAIVWAGFAYIAYKIAAVVARSTRARTASRPKVE
ncbi:uncharacterized protein LOC62_03G004544 [Vanrija pseudolonga]|uniref:Protein PBN1 n=1 Tax=Vanrija pseudolonga TaxID=143232 RepID=A0AAF0YAV8_9TREE|nr:hypothetical protein LOC62_03G004544 [Vanrija pseudolonga]